MPACFLCHKYFPLKKSLLSHFQSKDHGLQPLDDLVKCAECLRTFSSMYNLSKHYGRCIKSASTSGTTQNLELVEFEIADPNVGPVETEDESVLIDASDLRNALEEIPYGVESDPAKFITNKSATFIAKLYSHVEIPRSVVQLVVEGSSDIFESCAEILRHKLKKIIPEESFDSELKVILDCIAAPFKGLHSEHMRLQYFEKAGTYFPPEVLLIGEELESKYRKGEMALVPRPISAHYIPLSNTLHQFFNQGKILEHSLQYNNQLLNESDGSLTNFVQGDYWREIISSNRDKTILPLFFWVDEFEVCNPLGQHAGIHKLAGVYFTSPSIPPSYRSTLHCIFLSQLFHSADRAKYGSELIYGRLIKELNHVNLVGIEFTTESFSGTIYFKLALLLGDNLGLHQLAGYNESFSSNFPCRMCHISKKDLQSQLVEDPSLIRTVDSYNTDLEKNKPSLTGIKGPCTWHDVDGFHVTTGLGVDAMHDLMEGVCKYDFGVILLFFIFEAKYFEFDVFEARLKNFDFGIIDKRNKPPLQSESHLREGKIKMSASEMITFVKYFGIIYGDLIPLNDAHWNLYLSLKSIVEIVLCKNLSKNHINLLKSTIKEHNELYINCSGGSLKPKYHFLVHYPRLLGLFASFVDIWSMRMEAKHRVSKKVANSVSNSVNLTLTLSIRHQLLFNWLLMSKAFCKQFLQSGPGSFIIFEELKGSENLPSQATYFKHKKFFSCGWAEVSGTRYEKKMVIVHDIVDFCPQFALIEKILVLDSEQLYFYCHKLEVLHLDEHFSAYCVDDSKEDPLFIKKENLISHVPLSLTRDRNGRGLVTVMGV